MVAHKLDLLDLLEFPKFFAALSEKPPWNCWIVGIVTGFLQNRRTTMVAHKLDVLDLLEFPRVFAILPDEAPGIVGLLDLSLVF